jgi:hypothetical protein
MGAQHLFKLPTQQSKMAKFTYKMLAAALLELSQRCREFVSTVSGRGPTQPEFLECTLIRPENKPKEYLGYITLRIKEINQIRAQMRGIRFNPVRLTYAITKDGLALYTREPIHIDLGAEVLYKKPLEDWLAWLPQHQEEKESRERCSQRTALIHEDLVAAVWAPSRLAKRLEEGGWNVIEAL